MFYFYSGLFPFIPKSVFYLKVTSLCKNSATNVLIKDISFAYLIIKRLVLMCKHCNVGIALIKDATMALFITSFF